jgi:hypothetical protein
MKRILLASIIALGTLTGYSQNAAHLEVFIKSADGRKGAAVSDNDVANVIYVLTYDNQETMKSLHVKLQDADGGNVIYSEVLPFDANAVLPDGSTLKIKENSTYIGIGAHNHMAHYYATVQIEDTEGHLSDVVIATK